MNMNDGKTQRYGFDFRGSRWGESTVLSDALDESPQGTYTHSRVGCRHPIGEVGQLLGNGVIGSTADSGSASRGSYPCSPAF